MVTFPADFPYLDKASELDQARLLLDQAIEHLAKVDETSDHPEVLWFLLTVEKVRNEISDLACVLYPIPQRYYPPKDSNLLAKEENGGS